ncbi:type II toxin-antitoxin system Rv0910 family toxin [Nocardia thailandica]|uniref:type II toxin-antitoxin system Rv0910 family toxin n=1 Tax=Nocardia thailandica TaxID=257275 RepID=UPI00031088C6|nr:SRPBCC family protein [Nocardia thailandica]
MAKVAISKDIAAPQEKVWEVLANPARFEEWLTLHTKWKSEPPTELAVGSTMSEVLTIMGMANTIDFTVGTYEAPNTMSMSGVGMAGAKITFTLSVEAAGDGSTVTITSEFISQMMVGAVGGAIERASAKEIEASLEKFRSLVA